MGLRADDRLFALTLLRTSRLLCGFPVGSNAPGKTENRPWR